MIISRQGKKSEIKENYVAEVKGLAGISTEIKSFLNLLEERVEKMGISMGASNTIFTSSE